MSANIWSPDSEVISIDAESSNISQVFIATAAQVLFNLTSFDYVIGSGAIAVYRNGQRLIKDVDWQETSTTSITLIGITLADGEVIEVVAVLGATAANTILAQEARVAAEAAQAAAEAAAATIDPLNFATAAQGAKADTAVQPADIANMLETADIGVTVQAYDVDTAKTDVTQSFTAPQRGSATTDNDLSFDLNATNNFTCTPTAGGALTFTNIAAGQSGFIKLVNSTNYAITAHANTKVTGTFLATISATGTYIISYYSDGTNVFCATAGAMA